MSDESSDDAEYRELMLKKLQAYGDELLGYKKDKKKTILKTRSKSVTDIKENDKVTIDESKSKRMRRKERKFKNKDLDTKMSHLSKICDVVGIKDITQSTESTPVVIPNKDDLKHLEELNKDSNVKIFIDPDAVRMKKKQLRYEKRKIENEAVLEKEQDAPSEHFNLKKAQLDVRRCGITAMSSGLKEDATVSLLIDLGARAQKKKHINYRQLQVDLKTRAEQVAKDKEQENLMGIKKSKKPKFKKKRGEIGFLDGQIGVYRRGVQIIGKNDLKKVKRK